MLRRAGALSGASLAVFHLWLLAGQAWAGQLAEPGLLLRWLIAGGLIAALAVLRRRGEPVVLGRKAVAVWLLAAMLHGPAIAGRDPGADTPGLPEAVTAVMQVAAAAVLAGFTALLIVALRGRDRVRRAAYVRRPAPSPVRRTVAQGVLALAAPRPPPIPASC